MIAVPLTPPLRWVIVGSPAYLARHGRPAKPDDLMRHACIRIRIRIGDNSLYRRELGNGRRALELDVLGPVSANETDTAVDAALNGVGLAYCLERRVADDIAAGRLEVVLPDPIRVTTARSSQIRP
jgi:DNA-binding transcriptional LysR family regulator